MKLKLFKTGGTFRYCEAMIEIPKLDKLGRKTGRTLLVKCGKRVRSPKTMRRHLRRKHGADI